MVKVYGIETKRGDQEFYGSMSLFEAMAFCKKHNYSLIYKENDEVTTLVRRGGWNYR